MDLSGLCRHFGPCGGCQIQDVAYTGQLSRKRQRVEELLRASLGARAPAVRAVIGMSRAGGHPWHFRQKAAFVFGTAQDGSRRLVLGHYAAQSRTVVPVAECPVHAPRANRLAFALYEGLARAGVPAAGPRLDGVLRHVVIRTTRDEQQAVVLLVVTRNDRRLRAPLKAFAAGGGAPEGLLLNVNARPGPYMVGPETLRLHGRAQVMERVHGLRFLVSPTAFFQTNVEAAGILVRLVLDAVGAEPSGRSLDVLDLYAGAGLFSLPLAAAGHRVAAVEENAQAVRDAETNRTLNGVAAGRLVTRRARVEDALGALVRGSADVVVLDPPRQGVPAAVMKAVVSGVRPGLLIYVSCNPEALAAELPPVLDAGYAVEAVQPVDMFPHTDHIETVAVLRRASATGTHARGRRHRA